MTVRLTPEQRRVLELLAGGPRGYTKARLLVDGFTVDMLADLLREGLATAQRETLRVGGRKIKVERYRITDAGRRAIEADWGRNRSIRPWRRTDSRISGGSDRICCSRRP